MKSANKSTEILQIKIYLLLFRGINRMNRPSDAHGRHTILRKCPPTTDDNADIAAIFSVVHRDWYIACFVVCSESVVHILLIH